MTPPIVWNRRSLAKLLRWSVWRAGALGLVTVARDVHTVLVMQTRMWGYLFGPVTNGLGHNNFGGPGLGAT